MPYKEPEKYDQVKSVIEKLIAGGMAGAQYVGQDVLGPTPRTASGRTMSRGEVKAGQEAIRKGEIKQPKSNQPKTAEQYAKEAAARKARREGTRKATDIVARRTPDYVLKGGRLFVKRLLNPVSAMYSMGTIGESKAGVERKRIYAQTAHEEATGGARTLVGGEKGPEGGYLPMRSIPTAPKRWVYTDPLASDDDPEKEWSEEEIDRLLDHAKKIITRGRQERRVERFERIKSEEQAGQETGQAGRRMV